MKRKGISIYSEALLLGVAFVLANFCAPMSVIELMVFPDCYGQPAYYVYVRFWCGITMGREFKPFCDRYDQCLNWRFCRNAKIICSCTYSRIKAKVSNCSV